MTATVALLAVPGRGKKPFILIVSDSKTTDENGCSVNVEKIYDAGDALFTTAGTAMDGYREWLAEKMKNSGERMIEIKSEQMHKTNLSNMEKEGIDMWSLLAQFDDKGNPCLSVSFVGESKEIIYMPIERLNKNQPLYIIRCIGRAPDDLVENLNKKLGSYPFSYSRSKRFLEEYVKSVADRYPEDCNKLTQHKVLYPKV